jgi:hypothetical protein
MPSTGGTVALVLDVAQGLRVLGVLAEGGSNLDGTHVLEELAVAVVADLTGGRGGGADQRRDLAGISSPARHWRLWL